MNQLREMWISPVSPNGIGPKQIRLVKQRVDLTSEGHKANAEIEI
jgi:hypothetical protein